MSGATILLEEDPQISSEEDPLTTIWKQLIVSATIAMAWLFSLIGAPATQK